MKKNILHLIIWFAILGSVTNLYGQTTDNNDVNANDTLPGFDGTVTSIALQPDGKVIVGGYFTSFNGISRNHIARLNADGSLDTGFNPGTGFGGGRDIYDLVLQPDGKVIVGGYFTSFNGSSCENIARLNADGSLDEDFYLKNMRRKSEVRALALQPDGKILIGALLFFSNGDMHKHISRMNTDGSLDTGFDPGSGFDSPAYALSIQSDGKILAGGSFDSFNDTDLSGIAKLNLGGSLDKGFYTGSGFDKYVTVNVIAPLPDGKLIVGGSFTSYNGVSCQNIVRLNTDGTLDTGFNSGKGFSYIVKSLALQPDGKVIVGGWFTSFNETLCGHIARLNADGTLDIGFNQGTGFEGGSVSSLVLQPDGKVIVGGYFTSFNGIPCNYIARLNADGTLDTGFTSGK